MLTKAAELLLTEAKPQLQKEDEAEKINDTVSTVFGTLGGSATLSGLARTWAPGAVKPASLGGAGLGLLGTTALRKRSHAPGASLNPLSVRNLVHVQTPSSPEAPKEAPAPKKEVR